MSEESEFPFETTIDEFIKKVQENNPKFVEALREILKEYKIDQIRILVPNPYRYIIFGRPKR